MTKLNVRATEYSWGLAKRVILQSITTVFLVFILCWVGGSFMVIQAREAAISEKILVVTSDESETEFISLLQKLKLDFDLTDNLNVLSELDKQDYSAVIVCSLCYPDPNLLTDEQINGLKCFIEAGGRTYIEFSRPATSDELFGIRFTGEVKRALFERLYVHETNSVLKDLEVKDILDEHNSAVLPIVTDDNMVDLLKYDAVLGTYAAHFWKDDMPLGLYEIEIDLEEVQSLTGFAQKYGESVQHSPEYVEVYTSVDGKDFELQYRKEGNPYVGTIVWGEFSQEVQARYVRVRVQKFKRESGTEYLRMEDIEIYDLSENDLAFRRSASVTPQPIIGNASALIDGKWNDGNYCLWQLMESPVRTAGLVRVDYGDGSLIFAASKFSDFRTRNYRLTKRWESLLRSIVFDMVPEQVESSWVTLDAYTTPRNWQVPGEDVTLVVQTSSYAQVSAKAEGLEEINLVSKGAGRWEAVIQPSEGKYLIDVIARTDKGENTASVSLEVLPRREKYRQVLDNNIQWFQNAGLIPGYDGQQGVYTQRNMEWFDGAPWDGGPIDRLGAQRLDCNIESATMFYLYSKLTGEEHFREVAENLLAFVMPRQVSNNPQRPSYGVWPWLYSGNNGVFVDDNTKIMTHLLWHFWQTGKEEYLQAGLRTASYFNRISLPDGVAGKWCTSIAELDSIGCEGYRSQPRDQVAPYYGVLRWYWTYAMTGSDFFKKRGDTVAKIFGLDVGPRGWPAVLWFSDNEELEALTETRLRDFWYEFLQHPDVQEIGMHRAGHGGYHLAFANDSSITTSAADTITDQLYTASYALRNAWLAYKVASDELYLRAFHAIGDYLARIQMVSDDPRIDGAWMRGFDFENWEYYGANYDPNYGPYSAYTGWCNAPISMAFAMYLLDEPPFPEEGFDTTQGYEKWTEIARETGTPMLQRINVAQGADYRLYPSPVDGFTDSGKELTDGELDGHWNDGKSVGWHLVDECDVMMDLDLGDVYLIDGVSQRYGAMIPTYTPDKVEVFISTDGENYTKVFEGDPGKSAGSYEIAFDNSAQARYVRFHLTKSKHQWDEDFLFIGETEVYQASE